MTPTHLDWVEISTHAQQNGEDIGISDAEMIGRVRRKRGILYEDHEKGGFNMYLVDKDAVLALELEYSTRHGKTAIVTTAFHCPAPWKRFKQDRFTKFEP